jgi:hypothetical protein
MAVNQFSLANYFSFSISKGIGKNTKFGFHGLNLLIDHILERPDLQGIFDLETRRDSIRTLVSRGFSSFSNKESAWTLTLSRLFETNLDLGWQINQIPVKLPIGVNMRYIHKSLHKIKGRGLGFDLGGMIQIPLNHVFLFENLGLFTLGGTVSNLMDTKLFWSSEKEEIIPMTLIWGASYKQSLLFIPIDVLILFQTQNINEEISQFGLEFEIWNKIALRTGWDESGHHGGLGFEFSIFNQIVELGYSFMQHDLGKSHRFDLILLIS